MVLNFYELFAQYEKLGTKEERINFLRQNASQALRKILYLTYNPEMKFFTNKFPPNYRPDVQSPPGLSVSNLYMEIRKLEMFLESYKLAVAKKEQLLTHLLETLEAKEANFVLGILQKNLKVAHLSRSIVREAFPDLLPEPGIKG